MRAGLDYFEAYEAPYSENVILFEPDKMDHSRQQNSPAKHINCCCIKQFKAMRLTEATLWICHSNF
jgi:hypothetical protein